MTTSGTLTLMLLAGVQIFYGQGNATIVGLISDPTKAAVAGAHATLINEGTGIRAMTVSDSGGRYSFPTPVGNYRAEVTSEGFEGHQSNINLTVEQISSST
jgi:hypothetical protein